MKPQYLRILSLSLEFWGFSRLRIRNLKIVEVFWGRGLCFNFEVFWNLPSKILKLWGEVEGRSFEDEVCIPRLKHCQYFEVFLRFFEEFSKTSNQIHNFYYQHFFIHQNKQGWRNWGGGQGGSCPHPPISLYLCKFPFDCPPPNNFFLEIAHTKIW